MAKWKEALDMAEASVSRVKTFWDGIYKEI